jgi:hypothetical protein
MTVVYSVRDFEIKTIRLPNMFDAVESITAAVLRYIRPLSKATRKLTCTVHPRSIAHVFPPNWTHPRPRNEPDM